MTRSARPRPDAEAEPIGQVRRDGSFWTRSERALFIRDPDGELVRSCKEGPTDSSCDLRCWFRPPCSLRCEHGLPKPEGYTFELVVAGDGRVSAVGPRATGRWRFEPAPVGERQCRQSFALLGTILFEQDDELHDGDSTFGADGR